MTIAPRMETIEQIYDANEGNIHYIMNNYDVDDDDFEYMMTLKEYRNAG